MTVAYPNESATYRTARAALLSRELELRQKVADVAAMRRDLPAGGEVPEDYAFHDTDGKLAPMSTLFGGHDTLAIYSFMYGPEADNPCPMCASMIDGLAGQVQHISQNIALAVVTASSPDRTRSLRTSRGWADIPFFSAEGTSYQGDYLAETPDGAQMPMLNVFQKNGKKINHFWGSEGFYAKVDGHPRHVDTIWPLWNMLDFTPHGRGEFFPALSY